jgi:hypothetical protein
MFLYMFFGMMAIHLFLMPVAMLAEPGHFRLSLGGLYMAVFASAAMVILEALRHPLSPLGWAAAIAALTGSLIAIRNQIGISDTQYMREMIPHHSMAILTSRPRVDRAASDEVRALATGILRAQETEIAEMKKLLEM